MAAPRLLLGLAAVAVAFAAADTYVVVLALPDMMGSAGIPIDQLQRAAPIISGFLLGYVAMLPLIGRIADLRGRLPVLTAALVVFAVGSLVTALAYDLPSMVTGRFLQGVGGGGLVPATLALVADLYPAERRGVPLGIVSAVQELGSVLGPLFGAVVLAVADWPAIFAINLAVGLVLAAAIRASGARPPTRPQRDAGTVSTSSPDLARRAAARRHPRSSARSSSSARGRWSRDLAWGELFIPFAGAGRWLTPIGAIADGRARAVRRALRHRAPPAGRPARLGPQRARGRPGRRPAAGRRPGRRHPRLRHRRPAGPGVLRPGLWYLLGAALATVAFVVHLRRAEAPLLPRGALRRTPAWGAVVVSFFVGSALIAALIDIPIFARTTTYRDSQLMAALVLVRFLVALPVGAVVGGYLVRSRGAGPVTAVGMAMSAVGFALMSRWGVDAPGRPVLHGRAGGVRLRLRSRARAGERRDPGQHRPRGARRLASAMVVVARMVGMLVGISALTTIGLRRYYAEQDALDSVAEVCGKPEMCDAYRDLQKPAGVAQEQTVFLGAVVCAMIAGLLALVVFRAPPPGGPPEALRSSADLHR